MPKPLRVWRIGPGKRQPTIRRLAEHETQTFKAGTFVFVDTADGYLKALVAPAAATEVIAGVSLEAGSSLTSPGVAKTLTEGSVPNQANAVIIPGGVKMNDGKCGVVLAEDDVEFVIDCDSAQTPAVTDVGKIYGVEVDANGYWNLNSGITTVAAGACVEITELVETPAAGSAVAVKVLRARQQFAL